MVEKGFVLLCRSDENLAKIIYTTFYVFYATNQSNGSSYKSFLLNYKILI